MDIESNIDIEKVKLLKRNELKRNIIKYGRIYLRPLIIIAVLFIILNEFVVPADDKTSMGNLSKEIALIYLTVANFMTIILIIIKQYKGYPYSKKIIPNKQASAVVYQCKKFGASIAQQPLYYCKLIVEGYENFFYASGEHKPGETVHIEFDSNNLYGANIVTL